MTLRTTTAVLATAVTAVALGACGPAERHCEHDATDRDVPASHCDQGIPGYEWEDGPADPPHRSRSSTGPSTGTGGGGGRTTTGKNNNGGGTGGGTGRTRTGRS
ncbi:hypothetical protein [Thermomonospora cellulosilytica]|uniref:Lipoprotein n=1 Tax=Thermomonospora cellulosilytica TaxID=1411118 RepID=A0A7W3RAS2_9ACTN|nr:hypothetical protein [Thermomonospora cellulosilytica]MBA9005999.1 hypothetical protein [Thermomonospora cellulosilytica]